MQENEVTLTGIVEDIVYHNSENGYSVIDLSCNGRLITAVGMMATVAVGEQLSLAGQWSVHQTFGSQFKVSSYERNMPKTASDMMRYLSSGAVKGVGPATAKRIVERFGEETFDIIENSPERLAQIKGISKEKAEKISASFKEQFAVREVMIYLEKYGMTAGECLAAYKALGMDAIAKITENPYVLCRESIGITFTRADEIANSFSEFANSIYRKKAGVVYIIRHNLANGHTCLPRDRVIEPAMNLLNCDEQEIQSIIDALIEDKDIIEKELDTRPFLFIPSVYLAEKSISDRLKVMLHFPPPKGRPAEEDIDKIEAEKNIRFEKKQREAIMIAVKKGLLVLTGGPGTGKTTTLNGILELYEKRKLRVLLAAPTGRAAKRMSEVTGRPAKTLHRLLEVVWGENDRQTFARNMQNPLEADAVIIDELSMVDVHLFSGLLDALPLGCRLIMVGDSDQLPPVGAGNVLADIISSGLIDTVALTEVFRQSLESLIVTNAHRIVSGEYPVLNRTDKDFFFLERRVVSSAASTVTELYTKRLPKAYGYDPLNDMQIICPSRKGETGTVNLNRIMQSVLNPQDSIKDEYEYGGKVFREGDKVMQTKNNYDIVWTKGRDTSQGIYNGDIGIIRTVNHNARVMKILFDDKLAIYPFESVKELEHAYAVTVHKSQGCEFDAVVMPVCGIPPQLCYRNLFYTAVTRAKKLLVLVGSSEQLRAMVDNDKKTRRYSALKYFLTDPEDDIV